MLGIKNNWIARLKSGLQKSSDKISAGIGAIIPRKRLDAAALAELEEVLISADMGVACAGKIIADLSRTKIDKELSADEIRQALAMQIAAILKPCAVPLVIDRNKKPFVVLMVGVNGTGKTTTIGKLAHYYKAQGLNVMMAACDTFRAAAVAQLNVWADRVGCDLVRGGEGADPAGLAFTALERARQENVDVLFIDTAGRLHNKNDLMAELAKIIRVIQKLDGDAPHATLLTLDAGTGQNALAQVQMFRDLTNVTGLVVTKLDGSAKAGVLVALADKFGLPTHAIGVGEGIDDLEPFEAMDFAKALVSESANEYKKLA